MSRDIEEKEMSEDDFDWEGHMIDSIPFVIFVVLMCFSLYLVAVL